MPSTACSEYQIYQPSNFSLLLSKYLHVAAHRHRKDNSLTPKLCSHLRPQPELSKHLNTTTNEKPAHPHPTHLLRYQCIPKIWYSTSSPPGATAPSSSLSAANSTPARPSPLVLLLGAAAAAAAPSFTITINHNNNNNSKKTVMLAPRRERMTRKRNEETAASKPSPAWPCGCSAAGVRTWSSRLRC